MRAWRTNDPLFEKEDFDESTKWFKKFGLKRIPLVTAMKQVLGELIKFITSIQS